MAESERKIIEIPEICRVEGHSAVTVDLESGKVVDVKLNVFEGTRFFERIVIGHQYDEIPHITSRVCAICSTGHVLAAALAVEKIFAFQAPPVVSLYRELMHLGMIIESHATHVYALALPDFLETADLSDFAASQPRHFASWTALRGLGARIQTLIGGRPFHPVNLHVGGLSRYPQAASLAALLPELRSSQELAVELCQYLLALALPFPQSCQSPFLALVPDGQHYGYFGNTIQSSEGWQAGVDEYKTYLEETVVPYSHAKQSRVRGVPIMVGAMARLHFNAGRLGAQAQAIYARSPLASGAQHTVYNNLAQAIEIVEALERCQAIVSELTTAPASAAGGVAPLAVRAGAATGAIECPRGTLYHYYELDSGGKILAADMITPSAQNTARIEQDIRFVAEERHDSQAADLVQKHLETLIRAYDPCNTCATHMVKVQYVSAEGNEHG